MCSLVAGRSFGRDRRFALELIVFIGVRLFVRFVLLAILVQVGEVGVQPRSPSTSLLTILLIERPALDVFLHLLRNLIVYELGNQFQKVLNVATTSKRQYVVLNMETQIKPLIR